MLYRNTLLSASLVLLLILSGCATEVRSIKADKDQELTIEEGYLLLAVNTNIDLHSIDIDGEKNIRLTKADLESGSNYILVTLPAGKYVIDSVKTGRYSKYRLDDEYWEFDVKPGVITYVGHLNVKSLFWGWTAQFILKNKSSIALEYLEENFPNLLVKRKTEFGGFGTERFFALINTAQGIKDETK